MIYNPYIPHIGIFFRICGTTGGITWYNPFTKWESSPSNTWPAVGNLNKSDEIMMTSIEILTLYIFLFGPRLLF